MDEYKWMQLKNVALFALIGFLCWLFKSGWPCLLIVCYSYYSDDKS